MSTILDSSQFKYEKARAELLWGLKKIVWVFMILTLVLIVPAYYAGTSAANSFISADKEKPLVNQISTVLPEYSIDRANILAYNDGKRGYYVKVSNKITRDPIKRDVGYFPWVYDYTIKDSSGTILETTQKVSYLLPNQDTYVIGPISKDAGLQFEIKTNEEKSVPRRFNLKSSQFTELPSVTIVSKAITKVKKDNPNLVDIGFTIRNNSNYDIKSVDNFFLLRSVDAKIIGVGRYTTDNLKANSQQEIALAYPNPNLGTNTSIEVSPQYNYLDQENVVLSF
jgi:hypothetical protein